MLNLLLLFLLPGSGYALALFQRSDVEEKIIISVILSLLADVLSFFMLGASSDLIRLTGGVTYENIMLTLLSITLLGYIVLGLRLLWKK